MVRSRHCYIYIYIVFGDWSSVLKFTQTESRMTHKAHEFQVMTHTPAGSPYNFWARPGANIETIDKFPGLISKCWYPLVI